MKKFLLIRLVLVVPLIIGGLLLAAYFGNLKDIPLQDSTYSYSGSLSPPSKDSLKLRGFICAEVKRADGSKENLGCRENLLTDLGREAIRDDLVDNFVGKYGTRVNITIIGFGNGSAVAASTLVLNDERLDCGFGERAIGTLFYNNISSITVQRTVTYTCTPAQIINTTGLHNGTAAVSNRSLIFGGTIPSAPTLNNNDQITLNYTIAIT